MTLQEAEQTKMPHGKYENETLLEIVKKDAAHIELNYEQCQDSTLEEALLLVYSEHVTKRQHREGTLHD
jgi:hypothetical protein